MQDSAKKFEGNRNRILTDGVSKHRLNKSGFYFGCMEDD